MVMAGIEQNNADPRLERQRQMLSKLSKSGLDASLCDAIGHWVKPCVIRIEKSTDGAPSAPQLTARTARVQDRLKALTWGPSSQNLKPPTNNLRMPMRPECGPGSKQGQLA
jgi:hypothetical protein